MDSEFVRVFHDPNGQATAFIHSLKLNAARSRSRGAFALVLGATRSSDIPGISAAGATPDDCRYTPASDAEVLVKGQSICRPAPPTSPSGVVSPVVITYPMLQELDCRIDIIDCGTFVSPSVPHLKIGSAPAECLSTGRAMNIEQVEQLYKVGRRYGNTQSKGLDYLILAECVPGGTTTAAAVLSAMGYSVDGLVSTSWPRPHKLCRKKIVSQGITAFNTCLHPSALDIIAAVGDPMQAFVLGAAQAASRSTQVVLGGGSQMLAIWALMQKAAQEDMISVNPGSQYNTQYNSNNIMVFTTKWAACDRYACSPKLAEILNAPFAAAMPNFNRSSYPVLRAYEEGNVKEGSGAGASMAAAHIISNTSPSRIMQLIDNYYEILSSGHPARHAAVSPDLVRMA